MKGMNTPNEQPEYVPPPPRGSGVGIVIAIVVGVILLLVAVCGIGLLGVGWMTYRSVGDPIPVMQPLEPLEPEPAVEPPVEAPESPK